MGPRIVPCGTVADPKNFEKGGGRLNLPVLSSFIANAHNGLYAFYTEKGAFLKKSMSQ